jgi:hypothetical protein
VGGQAFLQILWSRKQQCALSLLLLIQQHGRRTCLHSGTGRFLLGRDDDGRALERQSAREMWRGVLHCLKFHARWLVSVKTAQPCAANGASLPPAIQRAATSTANLTASKSCCPGRIAVQTSFSLCVCGAALDDQVAGQQHT